MKKIFYLILLVISFSVVGFSQTNTFYKSYQHSYNPGIFAATSVLQTNDGYIIHSNNAFRFIKTDVFGYIEQTKEYPNFTSNKLKLIKTLDGNYAAVGNSLADTNSIVLIKFDQNLDTIETISLTKYSNGYTDDIIQLQDSSFIISSMVPDFYIGNDNYYYLRHIQENGTFVWEKETQGEPSLYPSYLVNLDNNNFLFWKSNSLIKMNAAGDTLWRVNAKASMCSYLTSDGYILCGSFYSLIKIDQSGNIIWDKAIDQLPRDITENNDGDYLCALGSPRRILELDTSGNQISQIEFNDYVYSITRCEDSSFAISGILTDRSVIWLLKTDNDLNYTAIHLRTPADSQTLNIFGTYDITWNSKNINFVNLDYSVDNQASWIPIIHYYPADEDTFNWTIPDIPSGDLFIRISDSFNPNVYDRSDPPQISAIHQNTDYIAANEILMWIGNNGMGSHNPLSDNSGFYWPGGEEATITAVFSDGLVWGGKVNGEIRVNGSTYRHGLTPGYIMPSGLPSDPLDVKAKIFKLKKDWQYLPQSAERERYEFDYVNWPVDVGAPWTDNDNDGVYTLGIDEPKIIGDETLFFVANDLDTATSLFTYGSNPIGLEFQVTTFGYNSELLKDVVFKKYKIINKSPDTVTDMYLTYWTDDDLGYASDDYVGCDTLLNLGYTYNGDNDDHFYGASPPAVAHMIVQPPIVASEPTDSARFGDGWKKGYKNTPQSSFVLYISSSQTYSLPDMGVYSGALQFYNNMQGFIWNGDPFLDPNTGEETKFCVPGDPVAKIGWYEGEGWPGGDVPGDRRFSLSSGPFNIAPGDTQEVVIAFLIKRGTDNINSIAELKNYAALIQHWYDNDLVTDVNETAPSLPTEFSLSQNYPNPFNPVTVIRYSIPNVETHRNASLRNVTLKVYDILGREVITLVNEEKPAGSYEVEFDGSKLSSGVYFYRIQAGSFTQTKKMMVLK